MFVNSIYNYFKYNLAKKKYPDNIKEFEKFIRKNYTYNDKVPNILDDLAKDVKKMNEMFPGYFIGEMQIPKKPSKEEQKVRLEYQKRAFEIQTKALIFYAKRDTVIDSYCVDKKGNTLTRSVQNIVSPYLDEVTEEERLAHAEKVKNMSVKERKAYVLEKLNIINKFCSDLSEAQSDKDFLDICEGKAAIFQQINEMEYKPSDHASLEAFIGEPLDEEMVNLWKEIGKKAIGIGGEAVARLGIMANPLYTQVSNRDDLKAIDNWFVDNADNLENLSHENETVTKEEAEFANNFTLKYYTDDEKKYKERNKKFGQEKCILKDTVVYGYFYNKDDSKKITAEGLQNLKKSHAIDKIYDMNDKLLSDEEASKILYENGEVKLVNAFGINIGTTKVLNEYSNLYDPSKKNSIEGEEFHKDLDELKNSLNSNKPWYMKLRSALGGKSQYDKTIDSIDEFLKLNPRKVDPKIYKEKVEKLKEDTSKYLDRANKKKSKSTLTKDRRDLMQKLFDKINKTVELQEYKNDPELEAKIMNLCDLQKIDPELASKQIDPMTGERISESQILKSLEDRFNNMPDKEKKELISNQKERHLVAKMRKEDLEDTKNYSPTLAKEIYENFKEKNSKDYSNDPDLLRYELKNIDKNPKTRDVQLKGIVELENMRSKIKTFLKNDLKMEESKIYDFFETLGKNLDNVKEHGDSYVAQAFASNQKAFNKMVKDSIPTITDEQIKDYGQRFTDFSKDIVLPETEDNLAFEYVNLIKRCCKDYDPRRLEQALERMENNPEKLKEKIEVLKDNRVQLDLSFIFDEEVAGPVEGRVESDSKQLENGLEI